jgi:tetratricopeptide (TPR) repeat protein
LDYVEERALLMIIEGDGEGWPIWVRFNLCEGLMRRAGIIYCLIALVGLCRAQNFSGPQGIRGAEAQQHQTQSGPQLTPEMQKAAQDWFPLEEKCMGAIKAQAAQDAVDTCKQTLDMSIKAGDLSSSTQLSRTGSYQLYGHALLLAGKMQAALAQEYMAVDEAHKCLSDKDQEYAMPYFWRGVVEANLGQNDAALADYAVAEATHRKAIASLPDMKQRYSTVLAAILKEHATLLDKIGRADEASKLRAEAASL